MFLTFLCRGIMTSYLAHSIRIDFLFLFVRFFFGAARFPAKKIIAPQGHRRFFSPRQGKFWNLGAEHTKILIEFAFLFWYVLSCFSGNCGFVLLLLLFFLYFFWRGGGRVEEQGQVDQKMCHVATWILYRVHTQRFTTQEQEWFAEGLRSLACVCWARSWSFWSVKIAVFVVNFGLQV